MKKIPAAMQEVVDSFERLPGIGPKSAQRLAFYLLSVPETMTESMGEAIKNLKKRIKICRECFGVGEGELCEICSDSTREKKLLS